LLKIQKRGDKIMKKICLFLFAVTIVAGFSLRAHAEMYDRGTDSEGNRLIYDSDFDITWYDYSHAVDTWQNQMDWASALTVNFEGIDYSDWRLPLTVDGPFVEGYDGTTTGGYNITSSELGHLFYEELGNKGYYDVSANYDPGYGLTNTGPLINLQSGPYWSGTEYAVEPVQAWRFRSGVGYQEPLQKNGNHYAIAVRTGDVAVAPEPVSMILFGTGGALMAVRMMVSGRRRG